MKLVLRMACIVAMVLLSPWGKAFAIKPADIIDSQAEVVIANIKKMDKSALHVGSETAHRVLKERMLRERTTEDWVWGIIGVIGLVGAAYYRDPLTPFLFANLIYAYWWKGPELRLERAQLIAKVLDEALGGAPDPCAS